MTDERATDERATDEDVTDEDVTDEDATDGGVTDMVSTELVPAPQKFAPAPEGAPYVPLGADTVLVAAPGTESTARWLRATVGAATGLPFADGGTGTAAGAGAPGSTDPQGSRDPQGDREAGVAAVVLALDARLPAEGYRLTAGGRTVRIEGGAPAGVFWGAQTLRQLLGPDAFRRAPVDRGQVWTVPAGTVEDAPRFAWRGLMLDVARHFLPKHGVMRYLDLLAAHKLNVLHFHLTDDQGWRIEIKRHPKLTEKGSWRARTKFGHRASPLWDERPHGGYYTQDDIREIVAYAAERHITVVPEIDIPGHSQAAISAYPHLGNGDIPEVVDPTALAVWDTWGISPNVLAPTEDVLRFYEGVFEEILELFPVAEDAPFSHFVHIGGDECVKDQWRASPTAQERLRELRADAADDAAELQFWFVRHFDRWLTERGRRLIGWDEILEGGSGSGSGSGSENGSGRNEEGGEGREGGGDTEGSEDRGDRRAGAGNEGATGGAGAGAGAAVRSVTGAGLSPAAAVSSWRGYRGGITAARAGHDVVMCPEQHVYLDHRQAPGADEPMPIGYVRTLEDVYRFEPVPSGLTPEEARHVLGTQANVWTEVMENEARVDYQTFPRLAALAEVAWSPLPRPAARDMADFERRMAAHYRRLDALGVGYRPPEGPRPWQRRPAPEGVTGSLGRPIEGAPPNV